LIYPQGALVFFLKKRPLGLNRGSGDGSEVLAITCSISIGANCAAEPTYDRQGSLSVQSLPRRVRILTCPASPGVHPIAVELDLMKPLGAVRGLLPKRELRLDPGRDGATSVSYVTHARSARLYGLTDSKAAPGRMPAKCYQRKSGSTERGANANCSNF
jgi:hypothetical protein